jgi:hypothetical protein
MHRVSAVLGTLAALFLAACTLPDSMVDSAARRLTNPQRVAVVAAMPDRFEGTYIGTTVFNNERYSVDVPGWNLQQVAESAALDRLKEKHKLNAAVPAIGNEPLAAASRPQDPLGASRIEPLLAAAKSQGFDTLIVILPGESPNAPEFKAGTGYGVRGFAGMVNACAYTSLYVGVYSTTTGRQLGSHAGYACDRRVPPWKARFDDYTREEKEALLEKGRSVVRAAVPAAVDEALRRAYL